jgi:hypothetical protein
MNNSSPPDSVPESASTASGPIAEEVVAWLRSLREGWTQSLPKPLEHWARFVIAGTGTFTWLIGVLLFAAVTEPRFANFVFVGVASDAVFVVLSVLFSLAVLWFGGLIAHVPRPSGPIGLFLEGLLLPAATLTIIALSMGRMPSAPSESAPVPVERPNGAETVTGSGLEEPRTNAESTSGAPLLSDGGRQ